MSVRLLFVLAMLSLPGFAAGQKISFVYTFENHSIGALVDEFAQKTGIEVERQWVPQDELKIGLVESVEKGLAPDIVFVPADHVGLYRIIGLSPLGPEMIKPSVSQENWDTALVDGQYYGAPVIRGNHLMLFYNRSLVSQPATSWTQMLGQVDELKRKGVTPVAWNYNEMYFFVPFLGAMGGWPITDDRLSLSGSAMAKALTAYRKLADDGIVDPACDYGCAFDAFTAGELAYTINGDWALREFQEALGDSLGIVELPLIEGKPLRPMFSTHVLAFPSDSLSGPKHDALVAFTEYMQSRDVQMRLWEEIRVFPVEQQAYIEATANMEPQLRGILEQLNQAKAMPTSRSMAYAWGAMQKGFERYMADVMSATDAAALMQKLAERELAKD